MRITSGKAQPTDDTLEVLRVGVAGLGAASSQILPCFAGVAGVELAAAADVRAGAREDFRKMYDRPVFADVQAMCRSDDVDAIWVATPNESHCEHTLLATKNGKHVICEKPMAVSLDECDRMVAAAQRAGVEFVQGHSKIFDSPIRAIRQVIESERLGRVIHIELINFNDWLQRPRLASELDLNKGGGVIFRQGPHQIDIVRYLAGGLTKNVRGVAGRWDPNFATDGNYSALLEFENGVVASVSLNGYGYFDITELTWNIGEGGSSVHPNTGRIGKPGQ